MFTDMVSESSLQPVFKMYVCSVTKTCLTLCYPMDCSPSGFSVHGIFQARILEWVAISSSRRSSQLRDETLSLVSPALVCGFFTSEPPGKPNLLDTTT